MALTDSPANENPRTSSGFSLLETKLRPPALRESMVFRPGLIELLRSGRGCRLTLLSAPTGYGKTTLLAQWRASSEETRPFAYISLDAEDSDPLRLSAYVIEAVGRLVPGFGKDLHTLLRASEVDFGGVVLPRLVNALADLPREVVIVLDDYHVLGRGRKNNPTSYVLEHMPEQVQLVISTRSDPPIPLGRLRASGQMVEIRAPDLAFGGEEARALLGETLDTGLERDALDALLERTEGWPAGIYLAALALRRAPDPSGDVRAFAGSTRHVADYLTEEVLRRQPPRLRRFLLRTSVLERFNAALGSVVADEENATELLGHLERSNLFLVALDDRREWYRYHHLFADLLRAELRTGEPGVEADLHARAAAWYLRAGSFEEAVRYTLASGDSRGAGELICRNWLGYLRQGRAATLRAWISSMPAAAVADYPPLALVSAWLSAFEGDFAAVARWISFAENGSYDGPLPDGTASLESGVAVLRASFPFEGIRQACDAGRRALELEAGADSPWASLIRAALGYSLYWAGESEESRLILEECLRLDRVAPALPVNILIATSFLALVECEDGRLVRAERLARRAIEYAETYGFDRTKLASTSHEVLGMVLASRNQTQQAVEEFELGIELARGMGENRAQPHSLLGYAPLRQALGDRAGARALLEEARVLIEGYADPGLRLVSMLDQTEHKLRLAPRRAEPGQGLSEAEMEVLWLLARDLQRRQIADSLYLSMNTVKSHLRAIYRKFGVSSREEAVEAARRLGIIT